MRLRRALRLRRKQEAPASWLVVGLGNPGEQYSRNRHNAGAWTVNELARRAGVKLKAEGRSIRIAFGEVAGERVALVRPRTYVNESGRAMAQALRTSGAPLERTIVVFDELDLPLGAVRLRDGGGAGGHNGLKSIIAVSGAEFARVRIGIGRPLGRRRADARPRSGRGLRAHEPGGSGARDAGGDRMARGGRGRGGHRGGGGSGGLAIQPAGDGERA